MKKALLLTLCVLAFPALAAEKTQPSGATWTGSNLSEATIKQVQTDKYNYTDCITKKHKNRAIKKLMLVSLLMLL